MIRTIFVTVAAALLATTLSTTAAQACLSCEYKPEVLNSAGVVTAKKRERVDAAVKSRSKSRAAQEHKSKPRRDVAEEHARSKRHRQHQDEDTATASTDVAKPAADTAAAAAPAADTAKVNSVYNTLIKTQQPGSAQEPAKPVETAAPPVAATVATTPSGSATAAKAVDTADVGVAADSSSSEDDTSSAVVAATPGSSSETVTVSHEKGDKATGCKKFFPMADLTLTVDCK